MCALLVKLSLCVSVTNLAKIKNFDILADIFYEQRLHTDRIIQKIQKRNSNNALVQFQFKPFKFLFFYLRAESTD